MTDHVDLADSELHEPKGMQGLTAGASDVGKVVVSKGDGTSEARKLKASEIDELEIAALSGTYFDSNMSTATVVVATEEKQYYLIGAAPTQVISVQLPDPSVFTGIAISLKRLDGNYGDGSEVKFIPNASETIEGASELVLKLQDTSISVISDGTNWEIVHDLYPVKPLFGFWDYNDDATSTTPLSVTAATPTALPNDELGPATNKTYKPLDMTDIWDAAAGEFDWTELSLGDTVDIRLDIEVTTSVANQEVKVDLELGQGGSPYKISFGNAIYKTAGAQDIVRFNSIYMGDANTMNNPAQFIIESPDACDVEVRGWYVRVVGTKETY